MRATLLDRFAVSNQALGSGSVGTSMGAGGRSGSARIHASRVGGAVMKSSNDAAAFDQVQLVALLEAATRICDQRVGSWRS